MISRKTIMAVMAIILAIATFFQQQLGLSLDSGQAVAAVGVIAVYLFGEAKNDSLRLKTKIFQEKKYRDPTFWIAFLSSILPVVNDKFGLNLPVELVVSVLAALIGIIFKKRQTNLKNA